MEAVQSALWPPPTSGLNRLATTSPRRYQGGLLMVHTFSLKISNKRGLWQYKTFDHDIVNMLHMRVLLNKICLVLGYDYNERNNVYLFSVSPEPFEGYQFALKKMKEQWDGYGTGCYYTVTQSKLPEQFRAEGLFPAFVKDKYLCIEWPEAIYVKLELSKTGAIVN
jgi:hypothetical protein